MSSAFFLEKCINIDLSDKYFFRLFHSYLNFNLVVFFEFAEINWHRVLQHSYFIPKIDYLPFFTVRCSLAVPHSAFRITSRFIYFTNRIELIRILINIRLYWLIAWKIIFFCESICFYRMVFSMHAVANAVDENMLDIFATVKVDIHQLW